MVSKPREYKQQNFTDETKKKFEKTDFCYKKWIYRFAESSDTIITILIKKYRKKIYKIEQINEN